MNDITAWLPILACAGAVAWVLGYIIGERAGRKAEGASLRHLHQMIDVYQAMCEIEQPDTQERGPKGDVIAGINDVAAYRREHSRDGTAW